MAPEGIYLHSFKVLMWVNTGIIVVGVLFAVKGRVKLHRMLNSLALSTTLAAAVGLVGTVLAGWEYASLTTPLRLGIHRSFSSPLLVLLLMVFWSGWTQRKRLHRFCYRAAVPFWIGTLVTGTWFF